MVDVTYVDESRTLGIAGDCGAVNCGRIRIRNVWNDVPTCSIGRNFVGDAIPGTSIGINIVDYSVVSGKIGIRNVCYSVLFCSMGIKFLLDAIPAFGIGINIVFYSFHSGSIGINIVWSGIPAKSMGINFVSDGICVGSMGINCGMTGCLSGEGGIFSRFFEPEPVDDEVEKKFKPLVFFAEEGYFIFHSSVTNGVWKLKKFSKYHSSGMLNLYVVTGMAACREQETEAE